MRKLDTHTDRQWEREEISSNNTARERRRGKLTVRDDVIPSIAEHRHIEKRREIERTSRTLVHTV